MRSVQFVALFALLTVVGCSSTQQPGAVSTASPTAASSTNSARQPTPGEVVGVVGAGEASQAGGAVAVKPRFDACALLTSAEIKAVQGEELKETKLAGQTTSGFAISQCFFTLPTFSNSISLMVAEMAEGPDAKRPEEYWRERFRAEKDKDREDKDKDRERAGGGDKKKGEGREEEEEEGAPPQKISGVGKEAYWVGNRIGGALYVLKGNAYLRISVGGPAEQASKIRKSKTLAQKALARL
jgi:hypothetical protein